MFPAIIYILRYTTVVQCGLLWNVFAWCVCGKGGGGGGRGRLKITLAVDMSFKEVIENMILDRIE